MSKSKVKKVLTAVGIPPIVPNIKVDDHTPSKGSPFNHVHCDICEEPLDKVIMFQTVPDYTLTKSGKRKELDPTYMRICKKCLAIALKLLRDF